jgi:hypothetical protein
MAKKDNQIALVKDPKIGKKYKYRFAGSIQCGLLFKHSESLTKTHGHPWFWFYNDEESPNKHGELMKYPVSIYNILEKS